MLDQCGSTVKQQAFDTTQHKEGVAMAKFLEEVPEDHVVLMAVQGTTGVLAFPSKMILRFIFNSVKFSSDAIRLRLLSKLRSSTSGKK